MKQPPLYKIEIPSDDILTQCMHCGLCLPVCPTYELTKRERSSPRGRIRLIKEVAAGNLPLTQTFIDEMDFCLDCQACVTACPAGVQYGQLVEAARAQIYVNQKDKYGWIKKIFFKHVFSANWRLKFLARLLRLYQKRIQNILDKLGILRLFFPKLDRMQQLAPHISEKFSDKFLPERVEPNSRTEYRVGFLTGCLMNVMFADINRDTVEVLVENQCEVIIPKSQVCCGSLGAHNGDFEAAKKLARKNIDVFLEHDPDAIVINSAGCSAFMKEYGFLLNDDPEYKERAEKLSGIVKDVNEFLAEINFKKPASQLNKRVTYDDACHLIHTQGISQQPREIIQAIPGIQFHELGESSWCCGSAGIYNIVKHEDSMKILDRKIEHILATEADLLITANPGCFAQISYGLKKANSSMEVIHPMTLLNQAYKGSGNNDKDLK